MIETLRQRYAEWRNGHWITPRGMDKYMEMYHLRIEEFAPNRGFILFSTCGNFIDNSTFGIKVSFRDGRTTRRSKWIVGVGVREYFGGTGHDCPVYHCAIKRDYPAEYIVSIATTEFDDKEVRRFKCQSRWFFTLRKEIEALLSEATVTLNEILPASPFFPEESEERMTKFTNFRDSLVEDIKTSILNIKIEDESK